MCQMSLHTEFQVSMLSIITPPTEHKGLLYTSQNNKCDEILTLSEI